MHAEYFFQEFNALQNNFVVIGKRKHVKILVHPEVWHLLLSKLN